MPDQRNEPLPVAPEPDLAGQAAVVTGGAGVIGEAIGQVLASSGASVVLGDVVGDRAEAAAARIGARAVGLEVDVRSPDSAGALIDRCLDLHGRIDILVNAAGITHVTPLLEVSAEEWRNVFAVNLDGALFSLQAAARAMRAQAPSDTTGCRGKVVNVSSQGAEFSIPTSTAYGASKRALNYLTQTAAVALADDLISVTGVYPGMVYDGMWKAVNLERSRLRGEDFDERVRRDLADTPSGTFQDPLDLARIVRFAVAYRGLDLSGKTIWSEPHVA